jgi:hypothetical protein
MHDRLFTAEWASKHGATVAKLEAALAQPAEGGKKPFPAPGAWFPTDVLGNPMREYQPGKWEGATWPSETKPAEGGGAVVEVPDLSESGRQQFFDSVAHLPVGTKLYATPPASQEQAENRELRRMLCVAHAGGAAYMAAALRGQQPSGEVPFDTETLRKTVTRHALQIDEQATLEDFPEALAFQIEMARALLREFGLPATPKPEPMTRDELDRCRQWFNCTEDAHALYLDKHDYALAKKLYEALGMRVPHRVIKGQA